MDSMKKFFDYVTEMRIQTSADDMAILPAAATLLLADELRALNETQQAILAVEREMLAAPAQDKDAPFFQRRKAELVETLKAMSGAGHVAISPDTTTQSMRIAFAFENTDIITVNVPMALATGTPTEFTAKMQRALEIGKAAAEDRRERGDVAIKVTVDLGETGAKAAAPRVTVTRDGGEG